MLYQFQFSALSFLPSNIFIMSSKILFFSVLMFFLMFSVNAGKVWTLSRSVLHSGADCACKLEWNKNLCYKFLPSATDEKGPCVSFTCSRKYVCVEKSSIYCVFEQRNSKILPIDSTANQLFCERKDVSFKVLVKQE